MLSSSADSRITACIHYLRQMLFHVFELRATLPPKNKAKFKKNNSTQHRKLYKNSISYDAKTVSSYESYHIRFSLYMYVRWHDTRANVGIVIKNLQVRTLLHNDKLRQTVDTDDTDDVPCDEYRPALHG